MTSGIKRTTKWAVPVNVNIKKQVKSALSKKEVAKEYASAKDPEYFVRKLREYIEQENYKNKKLRYLSDVMDVGNKSLVPFDATLDAFNIFAGVGTAAKGLITLGKLPAYLAYDAYYLGRTKDIKGTIENLIWEATSWIAPGSLPHLLNHYTAQADRYALERGIEKFLKSIKKRKVIDLDSHRKKHNLEELSKAA